MIDLPRIGQGGSFQDGYSESECVNAIRMGIDLGMTLIDTAEIYDDGHSEEIIGKAISGCRDNVILATKFSPENSSYDSILKSAEGSLRRLKLDYIDIYQVHWPNPSIPLEETMRALVHLQDSGKIAHIGLCNFSKSKIIKAHEYAESIFSHEIEYQLFDRFIEQNILKHCLSEDLVVMAYSPLNQGKIPFGHETLESLADQYGKSVQQIMLNWIVCKGVIPIPKAILPEHIKANAESADFKLDKSDVDMLDDVFAEKTIYVNAEDVSDHVYKNKEDAVLNGLDLIPGPMELSKDLLKSNGEMKPIRVRYNSKGKYDLAYGRVRYWAWFFAYGNTKPVPAYVVN